MLAAAGKDKQSEHARDRMHAVERDRFESCQRHGSRGRCGRGEGIPDGSADGDDGPRKRQRPGRSRIRPEQQVHIDCRPQNPEKCAESTSSAHIFTRILHSNIVLSVSFLGKIRYTELLGICTSQYTFYYAKDIVSGISDVHGRCRRKEWIILNER